MVWKDKSAIPPISWVCGYCGNAVGGNSGYKKTYSDSSPPSERLSKIYVCPRCDCPTAFIYDNHGECTQIPEPVVGANVEGLPELVESLYDEIRSCVQSGAYTSAVLSERKLLMHVAVDLGAKEGDSFFGYVDYLASEGYIPPNGREWVDEIRKRGNEANHEIVMASESDAMQLLDFIEMLLKFVYEFPSRIRKQ